MKIHWLFESLSVAAPVDAWALPKDTRKLKIEPKINGTCWTSESTSSMCWKLFLSGRFVEANWSFRVTNVVTRKMETPILDCGCLGRDSPSTEEYWTILFEISDEWWKNIHSTILRTLILKASCLLAMQGPFVHVPGSEMGSTHVASNREPQSNL